MLSFERRMELLDEALQQYTPESLYEELSSYPDYGSTITEEYQDFINFDLERMKRAVESETFTVPDNMSREEIRKFILDIAKE